MPPPPKKKGGEKLTFFFLNLATFKKHQQEYTYDPGLRDQNAITYLLKRDATVNMPHTQLVNRQYCLNCYWRDLLELGTLSSDDTRVHFINHFSGCQMCTQQNKNDDYKECESEYVKSYEYADSQFKKALVSGLFLFVSPPPLEGERRSVSGAKKPFSCLFPSSEVTVERRSLSLVSFVSFFE